MKEKTCSKCGVTKPLTTERWYRNRTEKDGFQGWCKECKQATWRRDHPLIEKPPPDTKLCPKCTILKPLTEEFWHRSKAQSGGWQGWCQSCQSKAMKTINTRNKLSVLSHYSKGIPKCSCCGETEFSFLTLDHINNNGAQHRKSINRAPIMGWIIKNGFPEGFQVLCANCHLSKTHHGICIPHNKTF